MLTTFITPHLREFFGDTPLPEDNGRGIIDRYWDWGVRHYWYYCMMLVLAILSVINIISQAFKLNDNEKANS